MIKIYELSSKKLKGEFEVTFRDGILSGIKMAFKDCLNMAQHAALFNHMPLYENDLSTLANFGFAVNEAMPANKKLALFCEYHMKYKKGQKYKANRIDGKRLKEYKINDEILKAYFTSTNFLIIGEPGSPGRHSVMNLLQYYNQVLSEMAEVGKSKFPDHWNLEFENKLNPQQLAEYWQHLRGLGLIAKKDERTGRVTDWIKKV